MADGSFALTYYPTAADLARRNPQQDRRAAYVRATGRAYYWAPNDSSTIDDTDVIGSISFTGRWRSITPYPTSDKGSALLTNADATIYVSGGLWRILPAATLTADHALTLGTTSAVLGQTLTVTRLDSTAYNYTLINGGPGAGTLARMPAGIGAFIDAWFDGTNWLHRRSGPLLGT